jgi:predicted RNA-binding protein with PUA-like domain
MPPRSQYWLLKTEPTSYGIDDLSSEPDQTTCWDGVRNYQARNFMRDQMRIGDRALLYHSNVVRIVRSAYPDHTSWDPRDKHFDPKSSPDNPRWCMVDVQLQQRFTEPLSLERLREVKVLRDMELLRKGSRLSVQPVRKKEFDAILKLAGG